MVSLGTYDRFWEWFGPGIEKIRHQKNLAPMWVKGFIYGFMAKNDCETLLAKHDEGTFVIRFSDRYAGRFAVAYVSRV